MHAALAPDLSLPKLFLHYRDIVDADNSDKYSELSLSEAILKLCKTAESRKNYKELAIVLARIAACTPHSADVERCISSNNILKTKLRSSLSIETENMYVFIHYNMSDLAQWNPAAAANFFAAEKMRRGRSVTTSSGSKSREQAYFKGVFSEARQIHVMKQQKQTTKILGIKFLIFKI